MADIFISYSRKDKEVVDRLIDQLSKAGYPLWVDTEDVRGGELWQQAIVKALEACPAFILILSPHSVVSDHVRRELDLAIENKKPVLPVLIKPTELTAALKYQLAGVQYIDLGRDFQAGLQDLQRSLEASGIQPQAAVSPSQGVQPPGKWRFWRRYRYWLAGSLIVAMLVVILYASGIIPAGPAVQPTDTSVSTTTYTPTHAYTPTGTPSLTNTLAPPPTFTFTPTPTSTWLYQTGLITYLQYDKNGISLYALRQTGESICLVEGYADMWILAVSPDHQYLAVAATIAGKLQFSATYPRFVESDAVSAAGEKAPVSLLIVPVDGTGAKETYPNATRINATFTPAGLLLVAVLSGYEVTYFNGPADGSQLEKLAVSTSQFPTPTPVPTATETATP